MHRQNALLILGAGLTGVLTSARVRLLSALAATYAALAFSRWLYDAPLGNFFSGGDFTVFWQNRSLSDALDHATTIFSTGSRPLVPLRPIAFYTAHAFAASDPFRYHLLLLLVHLGGAGLLWLILRQLRPTDLIAPAVAVGGFVVAPANALTLGSASLFPEVAGVWLTLMTVLLAVRWGLGGRHRVLVLAYLSGLGAALTTETCLAALPLALLTVTALPVLTEPSRLMRTSFQRAWSWAPGILAGSAFVGLLAGGYLRAGRTVQIYSLSKAVHNAAVLTDEWLQGWGGNLSSLVLSSDVALSALGIVVVVYLLTHGREGKNVAYWLAWVPLLLGPRLFAPRDGSFHLYGAQVGWLVPLALLVQIVARSLHRRHETWRACVAAALALSTSIAVGGMDLALAAATNSSSEAGARSALLEPWWRSLHAAEPSPGRDTSLVFLGSRNYFDIGKALSADPGPGLQFLYDREFLQADFPHLLAGGFAVEPLRPDRRYEVFLSSFFKNEGFLSAFRVEDHRSVIPSSGFIDVRHRPRAGDFRVTDGELLTVATVVPPGGRREITVTLGCPGSAEVARPSVLSWTALSSSDTVLLSRVLQVPTHCGGFLSIASGGVRTTAVSVLSRQ